MARPPTLYHFNRDELSLLRKLEEEIDAILESVEVPGRFFKEGCRTVTYCLPPGSPDSFAPKLADLYRKSGWPAVFIEPSTIEYEEGKTIPTQALVFRKF